MSVLLVGLGGGGLPTYIYQLYSQVSFTPSYGKHLARVKYILAKSYGYVSAGSYALQPRVSDNVINM